MAAFKENTVAGIFQNRVTKYGDKACVACKQNAVYRDYSWNEFNEMVKNLAFYFLSIGVKKGERIALFAENRYEWWLADMAILSVGAVNVPIYATNSSEEAYYILENSGTTICLVSTEDHLDRVLKAKKKLKTLKSVIIFDEYTKKKAGVMTLSSVLEKGKSYKQKGNLEKRIKAGKLDDLATIIYTSGTTGNPKGVMLTNGNFVSQMTNISAELKDFMDERDSFLSFLPLSHVLERTCGYYCPMYIGAKVYFAESIDKLLDNFKEVRPTVVISVPRIYEKIHAGILSQVADAPALKKAIFNWAVKTAQKNLPYECGDIPKTGLFARRFALADKLVFANLKEALGLNKLRFAISGGGPLSVTDAEFFIGMGIKILEGFGLTETTPVTNFNRPSEIAPGSVGRAIPKTTIKISDEGELLVKGPQVMKGYYKNPKATKESFTKDGFFKTGDMAVVDDDGKLWITGRIKDIIVTSGGKNIAPQNIESSLKASRFIEQVAIIGDNRKYLSALIVPAFEELKKWAKKNNISFTDQNDLIMNDEINALIGAEIERNTKSYARVEQIRKFRMLDTEWTQETGELTPSQKVKRRIINEKYAKVIESMYPPEV